MAFELSQSISIRNVVCRQAFRWTALLLFVLLIVGMVHGQTYSYSILYDFTSPGGGWNPSSGLLLVNKGNLYGTTVNGGSHGYGAVYEQSPSGVERAIYSFTGGSDGYAPYGALTNDIAGNLYGTTSLGGDTSCNPPYGCGTVFELNTSHQLTVRHTFEGTDGSSPQASLARNEEGTLYGTTRWGGDLSCNPPIGCGTLFVIGYGQFVVLHNFTGGTDGMFPVGDLVIDFSPARTGNIYGVTQLGGQYGSGTLFHANARGYIGVSHAFSPSEGQEPTSGLAIDWATSNIYGTLSSGGAFGFGAVYKYRNGVVTFLYSFRGAPLDGRYPSSELIHDSEGNLYGTTYFGGTDDLGTVFKLDANGIETVLHSFTGSPDGRTPRAPLTIDRAGRLYGTTKEGGDAGKSGFGTVFSLVPD